MAIYSANNGDRGVVTLDGVVIDKVTYCDTEKGFVVYALEDEKGNIRIRDNHVMTKLKHGKVEFTREVL